VERPIVVLGLGNPGRRYQATRHNLGFRVVERLAERGAGRFTAEGESGRVAWSAEITLGGRRVVLAKPRTFMNRSGRAAVALCRHHEALAAQFVVVYDDADLGLGRLRIRPLGGSGGHNGVRSLIEALGCADFARVRLGVRGASREDEDLSEYVLRDFEVGEEAVAGALVDLAADAVVSVVSDGVETAMNQFNNRSAVTKTD